MRRFLRSHGHRGINELDFIGRSWHDDPDLLVQTIQTMLSSTNDKMQQESAAAAIRNVDSILERMSSQLSSIQRFFLRYLIPQAHRGVANREMSKNHVVHIMFLLRSSFRRVAGILLSDGILPEEELIFFATLSEVEQLVVAAEHFTLLSRLRRRKRIWQDQDQQLYEGLFIGVPTPIINTPFNDSHAGTSVCEGRVVGRARVGRHLEEAKLVQPGEILITKYTDIGWSPLFPIISGLITEMGGLLSHGAVVAREYGLPCVIAVQGATDLIQTGDLILLDATLGTVEIMKSDEQD